MASKLYPPQIEGVLPAFYKTYNDDGEVVGAEIQIPFGLNRAVALNEIAGLELRIKTVSTNTQIYMGEDKTWDATNLVAYFTLDADIAETINEGLFYKAQLAFIDEDKVTFTTTIGYWSTVGTLKCVAKPTVTIAGYDEKSVNGFDLIFVGEYQQDTNFGDSTEKVETYEFNIWDTENNLVLTSGLQLHNSADDVSSTSSTDIFKTNHLIKEGLMYYIQYTVTTLNNLNISSPLYKIMLTESVDIEYPLELHCKNNFDDGYIELYLRGTVLQQFDPVTGETYDKEQMYTGTFLITRGSDVDDYFEWNEIIRFNMDSGYPSDYIFRDFTVEQGITYKYRILQFNIHKLYSNPIYLTDNYGNEITVTADFEDMFIYDGKRQLKVRFNPKVTSFKNTIPELKIETIGSKYPFIFRNGHVNYKEFPIAGLVSYTMDDAMLFLNSEELEEAKILEPTYVRTGSGHVSIVKGKNLNTIFTDSIHEITRVNSDGAAPVIYKIVKEWVPGSERVYNDLNINNERTGIKERIVRQDKNLTTENIMGERYFKLKVLDWLTNGEVKLFRSPSEGNYLVRILNVSMTPTDAVGRMLHSFTGTCYEIDDLTYDNLINYGIVTENVIALTETHWGSGSGSSLIKDNLLPWYSRYALDEKGLRYRDKDGNWVTQEENTWDGFYSFNLLSETVQGFECIDFAPGDIIEVTFAGTDGKLEITIGNTGAYKYNYDDRIIVGLAVKPNPLCDPYIDFSRNIVYNYEGIQNRKFDTVSDIKTKTQIAKLYIGPYNDVIAPYYLFDYDENTKKAKVSEPYYIINENNEKVITPQVSSIVEEIQRHPNIYISNETVKFNVLLVEILHALARQLIPVFALSGIKLGSNGILMPNKYVLTPFGTGYVNYNTVYLDEEEHLPVVEENVLEKIIEDNRIYVNKYDIEDINFELNDETITPINVYSILLVFIPILDDENNFLEWQATNFYYDTYTHNWNNSYEPYISINDDNGKLYSTHLPNKMKFEDTGAIEDLSVVDNITTLYNNNDKYELYQDDYDEALSYYIFNADILDYKRVYLTRQLYETNRENVNYYIIKDSFNPLSDTNTIYLDDVEELTFTKLGKINKLTIGNGAMVELTFLLLIVDYSIEEENLNVNIARSNYVEAKENYFTQLNDYYKKTRDDSYKGLDEKIEKIKEEIIELAKNVAINLIDVDSDTILEDDVGNFIIPRENGTPILLSKTEVDGKEILGAYEKIIAEISAVLSDIADAVPLKELMLFLQSDIFLELLYGWNDKELTEYVININSYNKNIQYYVLQDNEYVLATIDNGLLNQNGFNEDTIYFVILPIHYKGLLEIIPKYFGTTIDMNDENFNTANLNNWFNYHVGSDYEDIYTIGQLASDKEGLVPMRWFPDTYLNKSSGEPYYVYHWAPFIDNENKSMTNRTGLELDNSMQIISSNDLSYNDTIYAILYRIDPNYEGLNFNSCYLTEDLILHNPDAYGLKFSFREQSADLIESLGHEWSDSSFTNEEYRTGAYSWNWVSPLRVYNEELNITWDKYYKEKLKEIDNYHSLTSYIENNLYNLDVVSNIIEQFSGFTLNDSLNYIQDNNILSLYTLAHTPVLNIQTDDDLNIILNKLKIYLKTIESDYGNTVAEVKNAIEGLTPMTVLLIKDRLNIGRSFYAMLNEALLTIYYKPVDTTTLDSSKVYYKFDGNTYILVKLEELELYNTNNDDNTNKEPLYELGIFFQLIIPNENPNEPSIKLRFPIINEHNDFYYYNEEEKINCVDTILNILLEENNILINNFWDNKVGRLVEAKDDVLIAFNELITRAVVYRIYESLMYIAENHYTKLMYTNDETYKVHEDNLEREIAACVLWQKDWTTAAEQSQIAIDNATSEEDKAEMQKLHTTALFKIRSYIAKETNLRSLLLEFLDSEAYSKYKKAKTNYEIAVKQFENYIGEQNNNNNNSYDLFEDYQNSIDIYNHLKQFTYDLLLRSKTTFSNEEPLYTTLLAAISEELQEYIDNNNAINEQTSGKEIVKPYLDDSNNIVIKLGYFTIKALLEEIGNNTIDQEGLNNYSLELENYYVNARDKLLEHYEELLLQMKDLQDVYQNRQTFADNLSSIISNYEELILSEQTKLRGKINELSKDIAKLQELDLSLPTDEDVLRIKELLAIFLLTLLTYYISEVERRYNT